MKIGCKFLLAILVSALSNLSFCSASEAAPASRVSTAANTTASSVGKKQNLHRFDFRLEGVSCARCIVNIRTALRNTKGVSRCEVALRKPYGGVVIYNSVLTDVQKLTKITMTADPKTTVTVKDSIDEGIQNEPVVLIPKHNSLQKSPG